MRRWQAFFVLGVCAALAQASQPAPELHCRDLRILADVKAVAHGMNALQNREAIDKIRTALASEREERDFIVRYFGENGLLAYPRSMVLIGAWWRANRERLNTGGKDLPYETFLAGHEKLRQIFGRDLLRAPLNEQEANWQLGAFESGAAALRGLFWDVDNLKRVSLSHDKGRWPNTHEFQEHAEQFAVYFAGNPPTEKIFEYLLKEQGVRVDYHYVAIDGRFFGIYDNLPDPRKYRTQVGRWLARRPPGEKKSQARLAKVEKKIKKLEKELTQLTGEKIAQLSAPAVTAYQAPASVKPFVLESSGNTYRDVLAYRDDLAARYLDVKTGVFKTSLGEKILRGELSLEKVLPDLDTERIPLQLADGSFRDSDLTSFRTMLNFYQITSEEFVRYSRELEALQNDAHAKSALDWLIEDRRTGGQKLAALRAFAKAPPAAKLELPPTPLLPAVDVFSSNAYVRPETALLNFHTALTTLAHETASRGAAAKPLVLLKQVSTAAQGLDKPIRKGTLTRAEAIRVLSPKIDQALARSRAMTIDFATMEHDLNQVRERIVDNLRETIEKAQAQQLTAEDLRTPPHPAELEDTVMQIDELRRQLASADQLARAMAVLKAQLKANHELLGTVQSLLHHTDPAAPNHIDGKLLSDTLKKLGGN